MIGGPGGIGRIGLGRGVKGQSSLNVKLQPPSNINLTNLNSGLLSVSWTNPLAVPYGINVIIYDGGDNAVFGTTVLAPGNTLEHGGLSPGEYYVTLTNESSPGYDSSITAQSQTIEVF